MSGERKIPTDNKDVHNHHSLSNEKHSIAEPDFKSPEFHSPFQKKPTSKVHFALQMTVNLIYLEKLKKIFLVEDIIEQLKQFNQFNNSFADRKLHGRMTQFLYTMKFQTEEEGICAGLTMKMIEAHQSDHEKMSSLESPMYQVAQNRLMYLQELLTMEPTDLQYKNLFSLINWIKSQSIEEKDAGKKSEKLKEFSMRALKKINFIILERKKMKRQFLLTFSSKELEDLENYQTDILAYCDTVAFHHSTEEYAEVLSQHILQIDTHQVSPFAQSIFYEALTEYQICFLMVKQLSIKKDFLPEPVTFKIVNFEQENHAKLVGNLEKLTHDSKKIETQNELIIFIKQLRKIITAHNGTQFSIKLTILGNTILIKNDPELVLEKRTIWQRVNTLHFPLPTNLGKMSAAATEWKFANQHSGIAYVDRFGGVTTKDQLLKFIQTLHLYAVLANSENFSMPLDSFNHRIALCYRATTPPTWRFIDVNKPTLFNKEYQFNELASVTHEVMTSIAANVKNHPDKRALKCTLLTNPSNLMTVSSMMSSLREQNEFKVINQCEHEYTLIDKRREGREIEFHFVVLIQDSSDINLLNHFIEFYKYSSLSISEKKQKVENLIGYTLASCISSHNVSFLQKMFHFMSTLKVILNHENIVNEKFISKIYAICLEKSFDRNKLSTIQLNMIESILKRENCKPEIASVLKSLIPHENCLPLLKLIMTQHFPLLSEENKFLILQNTLYQSLALADSPQREDINRYLFHCLNHLNDENRGKLLQLALIREFSASLEEDAMQISRIKLYIAAIREMKDEQVKLKTVQVALVQAISINNVLYINLVKKYGLRVIADPEVKAEIVRIADQFSPAHTDSRSSTPSPSSDDKNVAQKLVVGPSKLSLLRKISVQRSVSASSPKINSALKKK